MITGNEIVVMTVTQLGDYTSQIVKQAVKEVLEGQSKIDWSKYPEALSKAQVKEITGYSPTKIDSLRRLGQFVDVDAPGHPKIYKSSVRKYLENKR